MPVLTFGEWLPDQPAYQNQGVLRAENVFPSASGFLPVPDFTVSTDALDARPLGAIQVRDKDLNVFQFAGNATKLYQNISNVWTDRSKVGGYATASEEVWEFTPWKNKLLATNFTDSPQQITFGASAFSDLTTDLKARHITVIRDFVVFANTNDTTDGEVPSRIRWSAFNDETDYTVDPATLSDFQDLKTAPVERIFGGEFGVIFQKNSVWRMTFAGAPIVFQFDEVLPGIGIISPGAAARDGDTVYFWSDRGFYQLVNGTQATAIGAERVDRFALGDLDTNNLARISCVVDPSSQRVFWAYPGVGNVGGRPNRIICYDRSVNKWTIINQETELLWPAGGLGYTLDGLDSVNSSIDALPASLDSRRWVGGAALLGSFDGEFKAGFFDGTNKTGTIETRELEIHMGHRTQLNAFRTLIDGGAVTAQVGTRNRQSDAVTLGSVLNQRDTGRFTCRANARYHRFLLSLTGEWEHAVGIQIEPQEARKGGMRG